MSLQAALACVHHVAVFSLCHHIIIQQPLHRVAMHVLYVFALDTNVFPAVFLYRTFITAFSHLVDFTLSRLIFFIIVACVALLRSFVHLHTCTCISNRVQAHSKTMRHNCKQSMLCCLCCTRSLPGHMCQHQVTCGVSSVGMHPHSWHARE